MSTINYLTFEQPLDLVDRIADRASDFNYTMSKSERNAMASLLSDVGVSTEDLIDVSNLADNYAINAEIVRPEDAKHYDNLEEDGETYYCYQW